MKKFRVGVVGLGHRGRLMFSLACNNFECAIPAAACDLLPRNWYETQWLMDEPMCETFPDTEFYNDYNKMLDEANLDVVIVETGADVHAEFCKKALEKNINVLTDIPVVATLQEAKTLWDTAQKSNAMISVGANPNEASLCSTYVIKAHICVIFSLIIQYYLSEPDPSAVNKAVHYKDIEKALVYINENITEKIELSTLAKIANMGKTNFSITFKKVTGMTVWEYILNTRIELAANYLIEKKDKYNITEIAFMSGFNNSAHFNKTFKKLKGKTPSDFKNSHENPCFF